MAIKELKTIIALRRDSLDNYEPSEVLRKGEAAFVELESGEVKIKVGDGINTFQNLDFLDAVLEKELKTSIIRGYFRYNNFYVEETGSEMYEPKDYKFYIDIPSSKAYVYVNSSYKRLFPEVYASEEASGISKLYNKFGNNQDGSISQKTVTEEIRKKFEVTIGDDGETLIFSANN